MAKDLKLTDTFAKDSRGVALSFSSFVLGARARKGLLPNILIHEGNTGTLVLHLLTEPPPPPKNKNKIK